MNSGLIYYIHGLIAELAILREFVRLAGLNDFWPFYVFLVIVTLWMISKFAKLIITVAICTFVFEYARNGGLILH